MGYASTDDLIARWQPITDPDQFALAEVLLNDADVQVRAEIPDLRTRIEAGDSDLLSATIRVECAMVKRAMTTGDAGFGVTSSQTTTGPFSQSFQYSNPMGDLYLTKAERRLLRGGSAQQAYTVDLGPDTAAPWILDQLADVRIASENAVALSGFEG